MKAVILAAGVSKRLRPMTDNKPKCLLKLNGETILEYQLECLVKSNISEILIVVGYKKNMIINYIKQSSYHSVAKTICNDIFDRTDNAYSLDLVLNYVASETDSIIIIDGDIIFDIDLLKKLIASGYENALVADNTKKIEPEDCKVLINNNYVMGIGKATRGSTVYTSMIKLSGKFLDEFKKELKKPRIKPEWYSEPLNRLLIRYPKEVRAIFTDGLLRCEIDTYEDLVHAKEIYKKIKRKYDENDGI